MTSLADKVLHFYDGLDFKDSLPLGIGLMNPYKESQEIRQICKLFYQKFYNDSQSRSLILGINPGRLGAGATGLPFTDTKRLNDDCEISYNGFVSHEPSSVFVYEVIKAFGGPELFYQNFYINSVCPLGFIKKNEAGKFVNYNYYDSKDLEKCVSNFIHTNILAQIELCGKSEICYCFGTGKNFKYLSKINETHQYFKKIIPLEHPRYIMQYKSKEMSTYIDSYLNAFELAF